MNSALILLVLLWSGWCFLHSLFITAGVQRWVKKRGGIWQGGYRLMYIILSASTLAPVLWYTASVPQEPLGPFPLWVQMLRFALLLYALLLFVGGVRSYNMQDFLGLRQWRDYRQNRSVKPPSLYTGGILSYLRHPWYSGGVALLWGLPGITDVTLVTRLLLSGYLILGAFLEERKMVAQLGEEYLEYCRRTPMFFPWRW